MVFGILSVCGVVFIATVTNWLPNAYASTSPGPLSGAQDRPDAPTSAACIPPGFIFGAGSSAFQTEGSVAADGRSPSIWDAFSRQPGRIADGSTGDPASDSYLRWRSDVDSVTAINARAYRFSISWSRLLFPNGTANPDGVRFYSSLAQSLRAAGVEPIATLYHYDLPLWLDDPENYPMTHLSALDKEPASNEDDVEAVEKRESLKLAHDWTRSALAEASSQLNFPAMIDTSTDPPAVKRAMARALSLAGLDHSGAPLVEKEKANPYSRQDRDSSRSIPSYAREDAASLPRVDANGPVRGWLDPRIIPAFTRYAAVAFTTLSPHIRSWVTLNEPFVFCQLGYGEGIHAPGRCSDRSKCPHGDSSREPYQCGHHALLAHAAVGKMFDEVVRGAAVAGRSSVPMLRQGASPSITNPERRPTDAAAASTGPDGSGANGSNTADEDAVARAGITTSKSDPMMRPARLGIILNSDYFFPLSSAPLPSTLSLLTPQSAPIKPVSRAAKPAAPAAPASETAAVTRALAFSFGWFADPLFTGGYPAEMRARVPASRLPRFTPAQARALVEVPVDFLGVNYYTSRYATPDSACEAARVISNSASHSAGGSGGRLGNQGGFGQGGEGWEADLCVKRPAFGAGKPIGPRSTDPAIASPSSAGLKSSPAERVHRGASNGDEDEGGWLFSVPAGLPLLLKWVQDRYATAHARLRVAAHTRFTAETAAAATAAAATVPAAELGSNRASSLAPAVPPQRAPFDLIVTENGSNDAPLPASAASKWGLEELKFHLNDPFRLDYLKNHTSALMEGIGRLNIRVSGYLAWSLVDNFEWADGMTQRFGLFHVDHSTKTRVAKLSAGWYAGASENPEQYWPKCKKAT